MTFIQVESADCWNCVWITLACFLQSIGNASVWKRGKQDVRTGRSVIRTGTRDRKGMPVLSTGKKVLGWSASRSTLTVPVISLKNNFPQNQFDDCMPWQQARHIMEHFLFLSYLECIFALLLVGRMYTCIWVVVFNLWLPAAQPPKVAKSPVENDRTELLKEDYTQRHYDPFLDEEPINSSDYGAGGYQSKRPYAQRPTSFGAPVQGSAPPKGIFDDVWSLFISICLYSHSMDVNIADWKIWGSCSGWWNTICFGVSSSLFEPWQYVKFLVDSLVKLVNVMNTEFTDCAVLLEN